MMMTMTKTKTWKMMYEDDEDVEDDEEVLARVGPASLGRALARLWLGSQRGSG